MVPALRVWRTDGCNSDLLLELEEALLAGGLVAFPTDTVYGVGGRRDLSGTEARLRDAKGSGGDRPFQILVADEEALLLCGVRLSRVGRAFAERFWPGPLTIVAASDVGAAVGLRRPDHAVAVAVVRAAGGLLTASSANRAGARPAVWAREAAEALGDSLAMVIDGGLAGPGASSSVVRVYEDGWALLREEAVSREALTLAAGEPPLGDEK